jgi:ferritin-like protein
MVQDAEEDGIPMSSESLHEAEERLAPATRDMHRAIASLMEELEAVDWYQQRMDATEDGELRDILRHNRDEEKEHAAMVLEWIRRRDPKFDVTLREYLFTDGSIVGRERAAEAGEAAGARGGNGARVARAGITVGSLRGGR